MIPSRPDTVIHRSAEVDLAVVRCKYYRKDWLWRRCFEELGGRCRRYKLRQRLYPRQVMQSKW